MNKIMEDKIKEQLRYVKIGMLFCEHNLENACNDCRKNITGNISGIEGKAEDIKKILEQCNKAEVRTTPKG